MRSEHTMKYQNNSPRNSDTKWPVLATYWFEHGSGLNGNTFIFVMARERNTKMSPTTCSTVICKLFFTLVYIISVCSDNFAYQGPVLFFNYESKPSHYFFMSVSFRRHNIQTCTDWSTQIHTNEPWHLFIKLPQLTLPCCALSGTRNQHALFLVAFNSQMSSSGLIRPETSACVLFLHTITTPSSQSAVLGSHT